MDKELETLKYALIAVLSILVVAVAVGMGKDFGYTWRWLLQLLRDYLKVVDEAFGLH